MSSNKPVSWVHVWANRVGRGITLVLVAIFVLLLGLYLGLPWLSTKFGLPILAKILNTSHVEAKIERAGLNGLDIHSISIGPESGITIRRLYVHWNFLGLVQGQIDSIELVDAQVHLVENNEQWSIAGLPELLVPNNEEKKDKLGFFPVIHEFFVHGQIFLAGSQLNTSLPISMNGSLESSGQLITQVQTALAGQTLALNVEANLKTLDLSLACSVPSASLASLAGLIPGFSVPLGGHIGLEAKVTRMLEGHPTMSAKVILDHGYTVLGGQYLAQKEFWTAQGQWNESGLNLDLAPIKLVRPVSLAPVSLVPVSLVFTIQDIDLDLQEQKLSCNWSLILEEIPVLHLSPQLSGSLEAWNSDQELTVRIQGQAQAMAGTLNQFTLDLEPSLFHLAALVSPKATSLQAELDLGKVNISHETTTLSMAGVNLQANATLDSDFYGTVDVHGGKLSLQQPGVSVSASLEAEAQFAVGQESQVHGMLKAGFSGQSGNLRATGSLNLPLSWPQATSKPGSANAKLIWNKVELAQISSRIENNVHGFMLDGQLSLIPLAVQANFKGQIAPANIRQSWVELNAKQKVTLPAKLSQFSPKLSSWSGTGLLEVQARLDLARGIPVCPLSLHVRDLKLNHAQSKISLAGGNAYLSFADLLTWRSEPDQRVSFADLQMGSIILEQGDIHFQVEALHSILVETCTATWAGGRVGTQAFRINPGVEDYLVDLYCDRVDMAQALGQFGMSQAQGGGSVNGRIPVHYARGSLSFDNGFLFSTPGENGVLRIEGTNILTAGVPPDSPQYAQLDLAAEALKDFAYEWAKIRMNTVGQELVVSLELDGKPAHPLPFSFDRDLGGFARVSAGSPGSVFQGIRLDVNFKLPLDQLLQYRQLLELMNKGG